MRRAVFLACLAILPGVSSGTMVRYTVRLDGGVTTALSHSFVTTSTTFLPPTLSGENRFGALPSQLSLNLPSVPGPLGTFGFELIYADGASYLAPEGLQLSWLNTYGTYDLPPDLFGMPATFTTAEDYHTAGGAPEPASFLALAAGTLAIRKRTKRKPGTPS